MVQDAAFQKRIQRVGVMVRKVAVVAWGLRSDHRQIVVANGSSDRMRRKAIMQCQRVALVFQQYSGA